MRGFGSSIALIEEGANSRFGGGVRLTGPTRQAVKTSRQISSVSGCGYGNRRTEDSLSELGAKRMASIENCLQKYMRSVYRKRRDHQGDAAKGWKILAQIPRSGYTLKPRVVGL